MNQLQRRSQLQSPRTRFPVTGLDSNNVNFIAYCLSGVISFVLDVFVKLCPSFLTNWIKWCPSSQQTLEIAEKEVLENIRNRHSTSFINIGRCWEKEDNFIWTLNMQADYISDKTPLVLLHGFAAGIGLWIANLDSLSASRPVYAFDVLGFGRSSRPIFSKDEEEAEQQFVTSIEMWRQALGLEKMILLGHSMGGFLATSYAIYHPEHVELLILANPWGFPERPISFLHKYEIPNWVKFISTFLYGFNLLAAVRASGPLGPYLVHRFRHDLQKKFTHLLKNDKSITNYIYHCNAQSPSGEVGFKAMSDESGWARYPIICRMNQLDWKIPIVFIYGSKSTDRQSALQIKYSRLNSYVDIQVIENSGHHVYADQPEQFNEVVCRVCEQLENSELQN